MLLENLNTCMQKKKKKKQQQQPIILSIIYKD